MLHKSTRNKNSVDGISPRPNRSRSANGFPTVGMTLPAYNVYTGDARAGMQPIVAKRPRPKSRFKSKFTKKRIAIIVIILVLLPFLWLSGKFIYNAAKIFKGNIFSALTTTKLDGEDRGRVNILLAGNSVDDPGHQGASLTDSIMILSIDTKDNRAFMLSIPRDLWVDIPGYGHHKINEVYTDGESSNFSQNGYPAGGMGLLEKVVQDNLGLDINYYSLINYNAFRQAVDAVGGIDVTINSSDPRGLYDPNIARTDGGPLRLTNGTHHLDGQTALNLARARGETYNSYGFPGSDFDRTAHQREMLLALKSKIFTSGVIANPVKLSSLMDALGANVTTDMNLSQVRRLVDIGKNIGNNNIKSASLNDADGTNLLESYSSPSGESALIPAAGIDDFSDIQHYINRLTSNNPVVKEDASIVLLNATDTFGLAGKNSKRVEAKGASVSFMADAPENQSTTTIISNAGTQKPSTLKLLEGLYGTHVTTTNPYKGKYNQDFIVVLGDDQVTN